MPVRSFVRPNRYDLELKRNREALKMEGESRRIEK